MPHYINLKKKIQDAWGILQLTEKAFWFISVSGAAMCL